VASGAQRLARAVLLGAALSACEHELLRGGPSMAWVEVTFRGPVTRAEHGIAGQFHEALDCTAADIADIALGVPGHCFRKSDGSPWRVWRSGCGWEYGYNVATPAGRTWRRVARTYAGPCHALPPEQRAPRALTTTTLYDEAGNRIAGLRSVYVADDLSLGELLDRLPAAAPTPRRSCAGSTAR
jgi:hypothetical protein